MSELHAETSQGPNGDDNLAWRPLVQTACRPLGPGLGNEGIPVIGAFGTCGDLRDKDYASWRRETLFPIAETHGVREEQFFNPEVPKWYPELAVRESIHFARDEVLTVAVTNQTDSPASIVEAGFAALAGTRRRQRVVVFIENNESSPPTTRVARRLAHQLLSITAQNSPGFSLVDSLDQLSHRAVISFLEREEERNSNLVHQSEYFLPPIRNDLNPKIYLSGTCGSTKPQWMTRLAEIIGDEYQVEDSYSDDWSNPDVQAAELDHKLNDAVQLVAITGETESFGAMAELGPLALRVRETGQALGILMEPHDSDPKSPTNRTRTLAKAHLDRLQEDFPDQPIFVAKNLKQLAIFGMSEYNKLLRRLELQ